MDFDNFGEVRNGKHTYDLIANYLLNNRSVIIGWTDEKYTHLDLLFNYVPFKQGMLQRGLKGNELYVSIIGIGSFGFNVSNSDKAAGYISEKLNINGEPTVNKLAELINEIIRRL